MLKAPRSYLKTASTRVNAMWASAHRTLSIWIFGDFIYAILPLLVLAAITMLLGESFKGFLVIKEWSFATIVLFGISIGDLVRLKVRIQQTPNSYKLDSGVQLFVVLLIASVLVLALVILSEKQILPNGNEELLGIGQLALFCLAAFAALAAVQARDTAVNWRDRAASPEVTTQWKLRQVNRELSYAEKSLSYLADTIAIFPSKGSASATGGPTLHDQKRASAIAFAALERISETTKDIQTDLRSFLDSESLDKSDQTVA